MHASVISYSSVRSDVFRIYIRDTGRYLHPNGQEIEVDTPIDSYRHAVQILKQHRPKMKLYEKQYRRDGTLNQSRFKE